MEAETVNRLALIYSIQAEIEGMKAFNKEREMNGDALAYNEQSFLAMAHKLRACYKPQNK